jgi:hypothetical protein
MLMVRKNPFLLNLHIVTADNPVCSMNLSSAIGGSYCALDSQNASPFRGSRAGSAHMHNRSIAERTTCPLWGGEAD